MLTPAFNGRSILSIGDFNRDELLFIIATAQRLESWRTTASGRVRDKSMFYAFFEPSTRTRFSFIFAAQSIHLRTKGFSNADATSTSKGEPLKDTLRMAQGYGADVLVLRHPLAGAALWGADNLEIPVINAGDGPHEHPTQTLLDLYSIFDSQFPDENWLALDDLNGLNITFVGDLKYGRTVHSLVSALTQFRGCTLRFVAPEGLQLPLRYRRMLEENGLSFAMHDRIDDVIADTDVLYMTRIQRERFGDRAEYEKVARTFHLHATDLHHARKNLRVLHPLPRNKDNLELDFSVDVTPYAGYYQQAANGLAVRTALLACVTGAIETPRYQYRSPLNDPTTPSMENVPIGTRRGGNKRPEYVFAIHDGTVIDHIPPGLSGRVKDALALPPNVPVLMAQNLSSNTVDSARKDLLKLIGFTPSDAVLGQIAVLSPQATINFVEHDHIVRKVRLRLPRLVRELVICPNPDCISRPEHREGVSSAFHTLSQQPIELSCHYCDTLVSQQELMVQP